jgi:hypothetical protein
MSNKTRIIPATNLSGGWADILNIVLEEPGGKAGPLVLELNVEQEVPVETAEIRALLEDELQRHGKFSIDTTSFLIFPWNLWNMLGRPDIGRLREIYLRRIYPALKRRGPKHNSRGTYFQRMIQFTGYHQTARGRVEKDVNQLERVLDIWRKAEGKGKHPRHSALQATIFDPAKDHHGAAQCGFPCLQQVSFDYHQDLLTVGAYYPTQYLFDRGYGNYLGLCHLGQFMANQMGLRFSGLTCFIGSCHLGAGMTKAALTPLRDRIDALRKGHNRLNTSIVPRTSNFSQKNSHSSAVISDK